MLGKKGKKKRAKTGRKPGRPAGSSTDKVSLSSLIEAREFAEKVGGVSQAQALLKALDKLG